MFNTFQEIFAPPSAGTGSSLLDGQLHDVTVWPAECDRRGPGTSGDTNWLRNLSTRHLSRYRPGRPGRVGTSKHTQAASCLRYIPLSCESSPPSARPLELSCCVQAVSAVFRSGEAVLCSVVPHPPLSTQTNTCQCQCLGLRTVNSATRRHVPALPQ